MLSTGIFNKGISEAKKSNLAIFKMGAVVFKNNRIISFGHNKKGFCGKIHPKYRNRYDTIHAEQSAICNAKNWGKINGASIFIVRVTRSNLISMAYPCKMCLKMIKYVGIKDIYYSNYNSEIIKKSI